MAEEKEKEGGLWFRVIKLAAKIPWEVVVRVLTCGVAFLKCVFLNKKNC